MRTRTTVGLAALAILAGLAYLLYEPEGAVPPLRERLLLPGLRPDEVNGIEIARPEGAALVLERVSAAPAAWRVLPGGRPAEPSVVQGMLDGLARLSRIGAIDAGRPESDPALTGLGAPRLSVTVVAGARREVLRFGNSPPVNQSAVFLRHEGEEQVFLAEWSVFEAFNKTADQVRSRRLVHFDPHRVVRLEIRERFLRVRSREDRQVEYEKSVMERSAQGPDRGWYLRHPWEERLDDQKVNLFLADLSALTVEEFLGEGDWRERGLDEPQLVASVTPYGADQPVVVQFGGRAERGARGKECLYAHVAGSGEVAVIDRERFDRLPRRRGQFRSDAIFPFALPEVGRISLEARGLGRVVLEQREIRKKAEEGDLVSRVWEVLEPKPEVCRSDPERVERFVANLHQYRITEFLGAQPDLKLFDLDPPSATVRLEARDGRSHVVHFGLKGEDPAYMKREGVGEVFTVRPELVRLLRKLELNFRAFEVFNVRKEDLVGFDFEWRPGADREPVYYRLRRGPEGRWQFADKVHENMEPEAERLEDLLGRLSTIRADAFVTREPEAAARHRLRDGEAAGTLKIRTEGGAAEGVTLYFSRDLSERPGHPLHYARFEGDPVIFEASPVLVEALRRPPVRK